MSNKVQNFHGTYDKATSQTQQIPNKLKRSYSLTTPKHNKGLSFH